MDDLSPFVTGLLQKISVASISISMAICSRLCSHAEYVRSQNRPFWTWSLLFECASAIPCGVIAAGIAEYYALGPYTTAALAAGAGWIGTRALLELVTRLLPNKK